MKIFDVIKFSGDNDALVWKFPGEDFNTLSQLIVSESQEAVFFKDGVALDIFGPGRYTLHTQNIPLIRKLVNLPFNNVSPFSCQVYFVNRTVSMGITWTSAKIDIEDAKYRILIPIQRARGQFTIRVADSRKLLIDLVGTKATLDSQLLCNYFRGILFANIKDYISKQFTSEGISFTEIHSHLKRISEGIYVDLADEFSRYGIELVSFTVFEISVPEDDPSFQQIKAAMARSAEITILAEAKREEMEKLGYNIQQEKAFDVLKTAAQNEGSQSGIMGAGMGLGMGINMGNIFGGLMGGAAVNTNTNMSAAVPGESCPVCGFVLPDGALFCAKCGSKLPENKGTEMTVCSVCSASVPKGKFCLECGALMERKCANCGETLVPGAKFCLNCGNKAE